MALISYIMALAGNIMQISLSARRLLAYIGIDILELDSLRVVRGFILKVGNLCFGRSYTDKDCVTLV